MGKIKTVDPVDDGSYAIAAILMFTVPHTTDFLKGIYIFVTYNLTTTVIYTAINVPYGSLSTMMTRILISRICFPFSG